MKTKLLYISLLATFSLLACTKEEIKREPTYKKPYIEVTERKGNFYDGKYEHPCTLRVKTKLTDGIEVLPEGFTMDVTIEEVANKFNDGCKLFDVIISNIQGVKEDESFAINLIANNKGGETKLTLPYHLSYLRNPFGESGEMRQDPNEPEEIIHNMWGETFHKTQVVPIEVQGNIPYNVEVLDNKDWAILSNYMFNINVREHNLFISEGRTFRLLMIDNTSDTTRAVRLRISDLDGVFSFEGKYVQARYAHLTFEEELAKEKKAMIAIRNALGLKDEVGLEDDTPVSEWPGVWAPEGLVRSIEWRGPLVHGYIPEEIGDLDHCQIFALYDGIRVSGKIPESVGDMEALRKFEVCGPEEGYGLEGRLDECTLGKLAKQLYLIRLDGGNNLTGSVPEWLGDMPASAKFWIKENRLEGKVPEKVQNHPWWTSPDLTGTEGIETYGDFQMIQQPGYVLYL